VELTTLDYPLKENVMSRSTNGSITFTFTYSGQIVSLV